MKRCVKILFSVFLVLCLCVLPTLSECFAAPYTYTVVVLAAGQGDFVVNGEHTDSLTYSGLKYGDKINLSNAIDSVQLFTDKYYVKGLRPSGHDNSEVSSPVVTVTKDAIYVVAYGIMGDMVNYTIRYQDAAGNVLMPSVTGKGQVGDKPVVAYKYIEGYSPNAYNITGTLGANEAENVFTFTYTKVDAPTTTTTVVVNNGTAATNANTNNGGTGNTAGGTTAEGGNGNQATGVNDLEQPFVPAEVTEAVEPAGTGTETGEAAGSTPTTVDLIDLDDEDVALAAGPGGTGNSDIEGDAKESRVSWLIILAIVIFIILVALLICYIKNKRELESEDEDII